MVGLLLPLKVAQTINWPKKGQKIPSKIWNKFWGFCPFFLAQNPLNFQLRWDFTYEIVGPNRTGPSKMARSSSPPRWPEWSPVPISIICSAREPQRMKAACSCNELMRTGTVFCSSGSPAKEWGGEQPFGLFPTTRHPILSRGMCAPGWAASKQYEECPRSQPTKEAGGWGPDKIIIRTQIWWHHGRSRMMDMLELGCDMTEGRSPRELPERSEVWGNMRPGGAKPRKRSRKRKIHTYDGVLGIVLPVRL